MMRSGGKHDYAEVNANDRKGLFDVEEFDDSDELEHFALQPPAVKTRKRRKSPPSRTCCLNCKSSCLLFLVAVSFILTLVLAGLVSYLRSQLNGLNEQLQEVKKNVETGNQETPEALQNVHSSIKDINTKLAGLKEIQTKEDDLGKQVKTLNEDVGKLSKSVSEASKITNLPDQVQQIKQNLATMGSSVSTLQDQVKTFNSFKDKYDKDHDDMKQAIDKMAVQMTALRSKTANFSSSSSPSSDNADITEISTRLSTLANAFKEKMSSVESALQLVQLTTMSLSNRTATLEKKVNSRGDSTDKNTPTMPPNVQLDLDEIALQVAEKVSKTDKGPAVTDSSGGVSEGTVRDLISTAIAAYMKQDKEQDKEYEMGIERLNITVDSMKQQLKAQADLSLSLSTTQREFSKRIYQLEHKAAANAEKEDSEMPHRPLHLTGIDSNADLRSYYYIWDGDDDGKVSYNELRSQMGVHMPPEERMKHYDYNGDGGYSEYELASAMGFETYTTPSPLDANATTSGPEFLHIPSIHTKEDLKTNFYRWDRDGDSFVRYDDLPMFLGSDMPRKHLFRPWDTDGDNQYSLQELIVAFGFPPDTTIAPATRGPTTAAPTVLPTTPPLVKMEVSGIDSESTLEAMFTYWDKNRDGFASLDELHEALGKTIPSPSYLTPYDDDGDGLFTQRNLKMAFGFIPVTDDIAHGRTQVPSSQLTKKTTTKRSVRSKLSALRKALEQRLQDHSRK
ncbi:EF-hand calcium-binding domain-containing protein 14-like isoform X6 [Lineus longissimus]|uniref:EF-hand calcium-binding domain-containing protein 14-like isoform X6 n=1 Tax=Lineus longissimus TaxID=88925 RepID=UPI00315D4A47